MAASAASAMKELRICSSLLRQCCSSWKGLTKNSVVNNACVVSGMKKWLSLELAQKKYLDQCMY